MSKVRIAIVEDEPDIQELLRYNLEREGFEVHSALDGNLGLKLIEQKLPDLVILDLMLPGVDGLQLCQSLKSDNRTSSIPVIMLTAKGEESDIVLGLGIGADDYITKPFSPRALVARVKAVLRRGGQQEQTAEKNLIEVESLLVDASKFKVSLEGRPVKLTATEFRIFYYLASRPGRVFTREQLLNQAIGDDAVVVDRNIDVHIRSIRKKLDSDLQFIETIRGVGYRFMEKA